MLAYILNRIDYTESSGIIELWTHDLGRVVAIAKGIKRPLSQLKNALCFFQPLDISIKGKNQLKTLCKVDWVGHFTILPPQNYLSAFYLNELLLQHLLREDPHPQLFIVYQMVLEQLSHINNNKSSTISLNANQHTAILLRWFEKILLDHLGYNILWTTDIYEEEITPQKWYKVNPLKGIIPAESTTPINQLISGELLLHLSECTIENFDVFYQLSSSQMQQIKGLLHFLLRFHSKQRHESNNNLNLNLNINHSSKIWYEMQELKNVVP
jgi:DNA repair protein RecO (recombination protein O)